MFIQTSFLGEMAINEEEVLTFGSGIPGFADFKRYMIVPLEDSPFYYVQSVEEGSLVFVAVSPFDFFPEYSFTLPEHAMKELGEPTFENVRVLNLATVKDNVQHATVNLAAPIVWNTASRAAAQVILQDTAYTTRHRLFPLSPVEAKEEI
ncbi:flagellar assembly factor FliW [Paenibacillus cellulosilyticus]|uniref:Flagellar assembly factor FliW n=1 Tax=Paenibacillus cellulosilyticus TaxID=375489 RepID=A0A2V2Z251_9BACL|nr:flagellar assembly protein FliW [Paenibacillus cellulosilyticus]PWW08356.1 flagellar assembly factor FliW [Paenibacillus cellulosilyticus]QKS47954.1 flagellar assembly protein FliW [Paenibacillus cellulosilyticus]